MSESPKSDKGAYLTRFSTPVPELDDHRFQLFPGDSTQANADVRESFSQQPVSPTFIPETPDRLQAQPTIREPGSTVRDFEQAVVDDDRSGPDVGRRFSVDPASGRRNGLAYGRAPQGPVTVSRESSVSAKSSSPPNSVEAFADPRRRERANTLESYAAPELEAALQRTVSGGTNGRRPTFSNASAVKPPVGDARLDSVDATAAHPFEEPGRIPVIDYEELEEFVALNKRAKSATKRKHSLSSQGKNLRVFHDLRPGNLRSDSSTFTSPSNLYDEKSVEKAPEAEMDEKQLVDNLQNENEPTRFSFFSSESQSTVHAAELGDLVLPGDTFRDLFELGPEGGVWWLDVVKPTASELEAVSRAFSIHPLTTEDILTQEAREKVELFKQYYFVCFRTFYQVDKTSDQFLEPVNFYMVVFRDGVLSFSFTENPHAANVRKRIGKLRDYVSLSSEWICYAMM